MKMKNELNFGQIKNEFNKFKKIYTTILGNKNILYNNDNYLIDNSWFQLLSENFFGNKPKNDLNEIFSKNVPIFFFNMESIIEFLRSKDNKLALISKSLINLIYEEDKVTKDSLVNIYLGNNKLIIEFLGERENDILLISNPKEKFRNENNEYILKIKKELIQNKLDFFRDFVPNKNNLENIENNNIIIYCSLLKDIDKNKCENKDNNNNNKQEIAKILISIYYYENNLKIESNKNFLNFNQCYLINPDWIEQLKNYYDYQNLQILLNENKNKEINYSNLNDHPSAGHGHYSHVRGNVLLLYQRHQMRIRICRSRGSRRDLRDLLFLS